MDKPLTRNKALEAAMIEYGRYIRQGEGSTKAVERAIEIYNYINDSALQPTVDRYMHDHKHVEVMPGQMMPFDAGDQPIHKAIPLAPMSDVVSVWKIELENSRAHNKALSIELHDLKHAIREALCQIEGGKCDLSQGAGAHEVLHNAGIQIDMDIIKQCCGDFL